MTTIVATIFIHRVIYLSGCDTGNNMQTNEANLNTWTSERANEWAYHHRRGSPPLLQQPSVEYQRTTKTKPETVSFIRYFLSS